MQTSRLSTLLESTVNQFRRRFQYELEAIAIGSGQYRILEFVAANPGVDQAFVARELGIHVAVASRAVAALERDAYLRVGRVRRRRPLRLTKLAKCLLRQAADRTGAVERILWTGFSDSELETLRGYLQRAATNLACQREEPESARWVAQYGGREDYGILG